MNGTMTGPQVTRIQVTMDMAQTLAKATRRTWVVVGTWDDPRLVDIERSGMPDHPLLGVAPSARRDWAFAAWLALTGFGVGMALAEWLLR